MRGKVLIAVSTWIFLSGFLHAQESIWVALIKGDGAPALESNRLDPYQVKLKSVFGFEGYHLLYQADVPLGEKYEQWILPRKDFYLKIVPLQRRDNGCNLLFEVYREKTLLVSGRYFASEERPLFINGPDFEGGRLIFLLKSVASAHLQNERKTEPRIDISSP